MSATIPSLMSGELTEMNAESARELTRKIRVGLEGTYALIVDAFKGRAWISLGYPTWDAYCQGEFGALSLQPPREERQQVIMSLREAGMSVRAISSVSHISKDTVARELRSLTNSGVSFATPESSTIGLDGKTYAPRPTPAFFDVPLDDSLLDMSADDLGIGFKSARPAPRFVEKPKGIVIPALSTEQQPSTSDPGQVLRQEELFSADQLVKASESITVSTSILQEAKLDFTAISDRDKEMVRGNLQDAVDRLNELLDRLDRE